MMRSLPTITSALLVLGLIHTGGCAAEATAPPRPSAPPAAHPAPAPCRTDDDCAITYVPEGGCCEGCAPRAVTRAELEAIASRQAACRRQGRRCPAPACASAHLAHRAACEAGRCVLHVEPLDSE